MKIAKETINVSNSEWEKHLIDQNRIYFLEREKKVKNNLLKVKLPQEPVSPSSVDSVGLSVMIPWKGDLSHIKAGLWPIMVFFRMRFVDNDALGARLPLFGCKSENFASCAWLILINNDGCHKINRQYSVLPFEDPNKIMSCRRCPILCMPKRCTMPRAMPLKSQLDLPRNYHQGPE